MNRPAPISIDGYLNLIGKEIGTSDWIVLDQSRINLFADATLDDQFIHVDPLKASDSPFGGTIAHGLLTLSMIPVMSFEVIPSLENQKFALNYGFGSVRFLAPVRSGKRVRGRFELSNFSERSPGQWQSTIGVTIELENETKPALRAEWITLSMV